MTHICGTVGDMCMPVEILKTLTVTTNHVTLTSLAFWMCGNHGDNVGLTNKAPFTLAWRPICNHLATANERKNMYSIVSFEWLLGLAVAKEKIAKAPVTQAYRPVTDPLVTTCH